MRHRVGAPKTWNRVKETSMQARKQSSIVSTVHINYMEIHQLSCVVQLVSDSYIQLSRDPIMCTVNINYMRLHQLNCNVLTVSSSYHLQHIGGRWSHSSPQPVVMSDNFHLFSFRPFFKEKQILRLKSILSLTGIEKVRQCVSSGVLLLLCCGRHFFFSLWRTFVIFLH